MIINELNMEQNITLALDQVLWSERLTAQLLNSGYHLVSIDVADDMVRVLSTHHIDAIVTVANGSAMNLFENLPVETRNQLLLLVVPQDTPSLVDESILSIVDAILPANPIYLEHQLRLLLHQHKKNSHLQKRLGKLEDEVSSQKRKIHEIEVLKNAIVRNVSHELRTPLLQVKSAVSLIAEDAVDEKLASFATNAVARLESLVTNITMLGHSLDINVSPIILRDAIGFAQRNLSRIWKLRAEAERIKLEVEDKLPPVLADKQGLSTVLQLLIDNALKFSNKPIEVIARREEDRVYIGVRDYGIGIEEEKLIDIFESFYQVDGSSTRRYGGTGVGLTLVKLILDYHNVEIHVESVVGEGSTFWFYLPFVLLDELEDNSND
jgi:signal transduction histidine kinase